LQTLFFKNAPLSLTYQNIKFYKYKNQSSLTSAKVCNTVIYRSKMHSPCSV